MMRWHKMRRFHYTTIFIVLFSLTLFNLRSIFSREFGNELFTGCVVLLLQQTGILLLVVWTVCESFKDSGTLQNTTIFRKLAEI
jgi:hypothetical protein